MRGPPKWRLRGNPGKDESSAPVAESALRSCWRALLGDSTFIHESPARPYHSRVAQSPDLLVSDADRSRVADELREHYEAGRLTLDEFQERLDEAHGARTEAQLERVLRQLPSPKLPSVRPRDRRWRSLALQYAVVNLIAILIWALSDNGIHDFWPKWVFLVTLIMFVRRAFGRRHRALPPLDPPRG